MSSGAADLSPEDRLLLCCAQTTVSENTVDQLNGLLSCALDWAYITDTAFSWNIAQLLYHNIKDLGNRHFLPPEVLEKFKKAYHGNVARNMFLYAELRNIVNAFQEAGVPVVVLKGAALAGTIYHDAGLRHMMDLDLLVRKDDLGIAQQIMTDLRYTPAIELKSEQWYRENHFHLPPYLHRQKPVIVEIHWHFTDRSFGLDIKKCWDRAREVKLMGSRVLVLSPEDTLVQLCIHLFNHGYEDTFMLRGLCDIAEILRHEGTGIDWELLQNEAKGHGMEKQVHSILYLVIKYYDFKHASVPLIHMDHADHRFIEILEKGLFGHKGNASINSHLLKSLVFDTFLKKARYLLLHIFPSREEMAKRYPALPSSKIILLYYLVHPFRLIGKYGKSVLEIFMTKAGKDRRE